MRLPFAGRRILSAVAVTAVLVAAIALPATALAATKFSSKKPASSSSSTQAEPKVSVYITDSYGIKGSSSFSMYIDGKTVKRKVSYSRSRYYKKVTVWFQVTNALKPGSHTVTVKTKNVRGKRASTSWKFTVLSPPPPPPAPMPITIPATQCDACHAGYPVAHPTTDCSGCHGGSAPLGWPAYTPQDTSAHTAPCSACHGSVPPGPLGHFVGDCGRCHSAAYPSIPQAHPIDAEESHLTASTRCAAAGCHLTSLTMEHFRRTAGGANLSCATCHTSADVRVAAAIRAGSTACGSCHDLTASHVASAGAHTLASTPSCVGPACHTGGTNVTTIHAVRGGCVACHAAGTVPTLTCGACHATDGHPPHTASPTPARIAIGGVDFGLHACAQCHADADLRTLHGGSSSCGKCHAGTAAASVKPWAGGCVQGQCHTSGPAAMHAAIDSAHTATTLPACAVGGCHPGGRNAAALHASADGCDTCHAPGRPLTIVCATAGCHAAGAPASHAAHPAAVTSGTVSINGTAYGKHLCSECHATTELQAAHGGTASCAKCHPSPRGTFTRWTGGCVQGGCHASGALAMHATVDSSHTVAVTPACTVAGCHAGGRDVAAIHSGSGGCAVCHAPGMKATLTCAAAGCHPPNTTANHASHPATVTSGTITINSVGYGKRLCSECHATTELQAVHGGASGCSKCHPSPRDSVPTWNRGCAQGECHKAGTPLGMHGSLNTGHTSSATDACTAVGCHIGGRDVAAVHAAVSGRSDSGCRICHGVGVTPTRVCTTSGCHPSGAPASHDAHPATVTSATLSILGTSYGKRLCSECHATTELQAVHGGDSSCVKCHPSPRGTFSAWSGGCAQGSCHKAGTALAMHGSIDGAHSAPAGACVTALCHGGNAATLHAPGPGCPACHASGRTPTLVCSTAGCHPGDPHPSHASAPSPISFTIGGASFGTHACSECHASSDLRDLHGGSSGCSKCHPSPRNTFADWNSTCVQGGCHAPAGTASMHGSIDSAHQAATGGCVVTGCHAANVASLHAPGRGCVVCHASGAPLTKVCAVSGCHATGAPASHASHPAAITSATITINGTGYASQPCSKCHATTELQAAHGGTSSCSKCHPAPRGTFTAWSGGCVQGGCHTAGSALAMHGSATGAHMTATAPSCTQTGCHAGGSDAAAIHAAIAGRPDRGCGICHGVGKSPALTCTATACHPGGASAKHASHPASVTSGTISINGTNYGKQSCSACHASTELQAAHGGATGCGKCHPSPRSSLTSAWTGGCVQGDCHKAGSPLAQHGSIDAAHVAAAAAPCTVSACHAGGSDIARIHSAGAGCPTCHGPGRQATASCSASGCHPGGVPPKHGAHPATVTSATMTIAGYNHGKHLCTECHASTELQAAHGGSSGCGTCHPSPRASLTAAWSGSCVQGDCHKAGTQLAQHAAITPSHLLASVPSCTTVCHTGGVDAARIHALKGGCAACHHPGAEPTLVCGTCHAGDLVTVHAPYIGSSHTVDPGGCVTTDCHVSGDAALLHEGGNGCETCHSGGTPSLTCAGCHAGDSTTVHAAIIGTRHTVPSGGACVNARCHASADAAAIHATGAGCVACHKPGRTPSVDCRKCHPSTTLTSKHPSGSTAHTVNQHPCTSANCHGGEAVITHARSDSSCLACHDDSSGVADTNACATCHPWGWAAYHAAYAVTSDYHGGRVGTGFTSGGYESTGWILAPYARGGSMPCSTCHVLSGTANIHNFATVVNGTSVSVTDGYELGNLCIACHGGTVDDWHAGCFGCHSGGMAPPSAPRTTMAGRDCSACHTHGGWGWQHGRFWVDESTL